jgi:uncharacterized protein (TIGR02118 family)
MHSVPRFTILALAVAAAGCRIADAKPASATIATTVAATAAGAPAHFVVLYNFPKDPAAFEAYYSSKHLPLLASHAAEIGFTKGELVKFSASGDGGKPQYYRKAELTFASMAALKTGTATPGFKAIVADLPNFATGGAVVVIGEETK